MTFLAIEEWKPIEGYEGIYEVSSFGKVKSVERDVMHNDIRHHRKERLLKPHQGKFGYKQVALCKDGEVKVVLVHRLVATAFIPNPGNKAEVDHIDADPTNNYAWNLQWATRSENGMNPLTRKHGSDAKKGHPYWGRPHTDEEKKKISDALKGRTFSEEHRRKLSEAHKGLKGSTKNKGKHWRMEGDKRLWY